MSSFGMTKIETPYKEIDNALELTTDISGDRYILQNVIKIPGTYTFSIWYKSDITSKITFDILGVSEEIETSTNWKKYVKTVKTDGSVKNIYIQPSMGVTVYLYEGFLSE